MSDPKTLFRKDALAAVAQIEELPQHLDVVPLRMKWVVLVLCGIAVWLGLWSVFGRIDRTVTGHGVIADGRAYAYVSAQYANEIQSGMQIRFSPVMAKKERFGFMTGVVRDVSQYPVSAHAVAELVHSEALERVLVHDDAVLQVKIELVRDAKTLSGYAWTVGHGPRFKIGDGTLADVAIIIDELRPIEILFPFLGRYFN